MNILLITNLFPAYKNQKRSEVPYAIYYFAQHWEKQGHVVKVIRPWVVYPKLINWIKKRNNSKYDFSEEFYFNNINVNRLTINKFPKVDYFKSNINKIFKSTKSIIENGFRPDIILCHMISPSLYIGLELKKEFNIPVFLTIHSGDIILLKNKKNLIKFKKVLNQIDEIGFRSTKLRDEFNILLKDEISVINQPIIYSGISKNEIIDAELILKNKLIKQKKIFVAANLIPQKNIRYIIEAYSKIRDKDFMLEIAGEGPEKENLVNLTKKLGLEKKVKFLGNIEREKVLKKMSESLIFALVSSPETFGLVYLEAMANGCIVIGSKGEGIDGVIKENINGFLCMPKDVEGLVGIFNDITNMSEKEKLKMMLNAIKTAKEMTQEEISTKYINLLKNIIINKKYYND